MALLKSEKLTTREVTTELVLRDKDGNIRPLWNETRLGKFLREKFHLKAKIALLGFYASVLRTHNLITNVGHAAANGRMSNQGGYSPFTNIAIGIGTGAAAATDMALQSESTGNGSNRAAATATQVTTSVTNDTTQLVKTFNFTASFVITEEGILDNATAPVQVATTQSRVAGDTTVTVGANSFVNNDFVQWESEIVQVTSGGGTGTLTISRAQKGTSAASHASGTNMNDITANAGNLLARQQFSAINVANGDSLQITHKYQT
jgi:hypothetical protein